MTYKQHSYIGIISFFAFITIINTFFVVEGGAYNLVNMLFFCLLGSLLPDIDHPNSYSTKIITSLLFFYSCIYLILNIHDILNGNIKYFYIFLIPLSSFLVSVFINIHSGHRTITHSVYFILFLMVIAIILYNLINLNIIFSFAFVWGAFMHILSDGLTNTGVPFYYPFHKKKYRTLFPTNNKFIYMPIIFISIIFLIIFSIIPLIFSIKNNFAFTNILYVQDVLYHFF